MAPRICPASAPAARRDPYLDNVKLVLITLVIIGHLIERVGTSGLADGLYTWIYLFHMPAFVFVSGYLSRRFELTPSRAVGLVSALIVPYVVFQTIERTEAWLLNGETFKLNFFQPAFALWYLLALFAWRLLVPLLRGIKFPLLLSVGVSVASVTYGGISEDLSGARMLSFLPFFTLGLIMTSERLEQWKKLTSSWWARTGALVFLVGTLAATYLLRGPIVRRWFYMYGGYDKLGLTNIEGVMVRLGILLIATALILAVFAIVPRRRFALTHIGEASLYVYLLQAAIIFPLRPVIGQWLGWNAPLTLLLVLGGILLTIVLGSRPVRAATAWFVDPVPTWSRIARKWRERQPDNDREAVTPAR